MRVGRVEAFAVRYPEPNNDGKIRALTLVRSRPTTGRRLGRGDHRGQETSLAVAFVVERRLAPMRHRRDPTRRRRRSGAGLRDATYWDGNGGLVTFGISAIDMALWDIAGQDRRAPLHRCSAASGGTASRPAPRPSSPRDDLDRVGREFRGFVDAGLPVREGRLGARPVDRLRARRARDLAIARDRPRRRRPDIAHDPRRRGARGLGRRATPSGCAGRSTTTSASTGSRTRCSEQDLDGYRRLHAAVDTRICTGEKGWHAAHYRGLIESGAIDVIMIDPGRAEGVTGTWRVIEMAAAAGRAWNAHSWSSALNTAASLHLAVAASNTLIFELSPFPRRCSTSSSRTPSATWTAGSPRPRGPGLGVTVDEAVVRRYRFREDGLGG